MAGRGDVDCKSDEDLDIALCGAGGADCEEIPQLESGVTSLGWIRCGSGLSDFICSGVLKPLVCRLRPTHEPALDPLHLVYGYTGGRYGFCSSHAANTMAVGMLFSLLYKNNLATASLMAWVAFVSYSRMYLGVHYPSDIICGLAVGVLWAALVYLALSHWLLSGDAAARQGGS